MTVFALSLLTVCYGHTLELFKHHELLFLVPIKKKKIKPLQKPFSFVYFKKGAGRRACTYKYFGKKKKKKKKEAKQHLQLHLLYLFIKRLKSKDIHVRGVT